MSDNLTKLYKYDEFLKKVEEQLKRSPDEKYELIRFDIKNFKLVNSLFGMEAGDRLLCHVASVLRQMELEDSVYCRMECDRFAAFVPEKYEEDIEDALIRDPFYADIDGNHQIYIYMGIYDVKDDKLPVALMSDRAGIALSTIKANRYVRVAKYDESMYEEIVLEHELTNELPKAISEGEIVSYLQPQVTAKGQVLGAEALVRWNHPQKGLLNPGDFLPVFEKNYKIVEIDEYIWEAACRQLRKWNDEGRNGMYISVNISPRDFECIDVYDKLIKLVNKYGINPEQIRIEITESTIMQNPEKQIELIGKLRLAKFFVEMDDFGSGYSSLGMLKDIPLDAIKMDMSFLDKGVDEEKSKKVIMLMVNLIKELGMTVIAEGVETQEEADYLEAVGCDVFQGYLFSKPIPVDTFEARYIG